MSTHNLLNLLNKLGKRDKMRGLQSICLFLWRILHEHSYLLNLLNKLGKRDKM